MACKDRSESYQGPVLCADRPACAERVGPKPGSASLTDSRAPRRVPLDVHEAVLPGDRPGSSRRGPGDSPRRAAPRRPPDFEAPAGDRAAPRLGSGFSARAPARGARGGRPRHVPYRALWLAPPLAPHRRCHAPALFRHGAGRAGRFRSDHRDPRSPARTPARGRVATPGRAMWSLGNRLRSRQHPPMRIRSYPAKAPHAASASSATYHRACGSVHQPGRRFRAHGSPRGCSITRRPPVSTTWPSCSRPPTASKMLSP